MIETAVTIGPDEYRCAACGEVFTKGWSDEEALVEKDALWGAMPTDEMKIVCDDCFVAMGFSQTPPSVEWHPLKTLDKERNFRIWFLIPALCRLVPLGGV